ncbi:unnamed protein product, partial [marine sediment metagenome]
VPSKSLADNFYILSRRFGTDQKRYAENYGNYIYPCFSFYVENNIQAEEKKEGGNQQRS